ncbi:hypothetical protein L227DRAFT_614461 [Lentinus tigrinus ALCF2SS1-6]|uniref:Uncharacterized protein n=1 Tax=Lentinus tigrinus ALCF2SS1-6 TaxID=1328759 RepID=A0A5C2RZR8_9APHY|nr:hypothetical protein L227DRAFT_614461 [Lentinus tigrinus ALCF2SS1-6]
MDQLETCAPLRLGAIDMAITYARWELPSTGTSTDARPEPPLFADRPAEFSRSSGAVSAISVDMLAERIGIDTHTLLLSGRTPLVQARTDRRTFGYHSRRVTMYHCRPSTASRAIFTTTPDHFRTQGRCLAFTNTKTTKSLTKDPELRKQLALTKFFFDICTPTLRRDPRGRAHAAVASASVDSPTTVKHTETGGGVQNPGGFMRIIFHQQRLVTHLPPSPITPTRHASASGVESLFAPRQIT